MNTFFPLLGRWLISLLQTIRSLPSTLHLALHARLHEATRAHAGYSGHPRVHATMGVRNVNREHHESLATNDLIATWVSDHVGTMWFCYALLLLIGTWALSQFVLTHWHHAFDAYPYPFLFFCLGGIMQSLLMPMFLVVQNLSSRHTETRAEADYETNVRALEHLTYLVAAQGEQLSLLRTLILRVTPPSTPTPTMIVTTDGTVLMDPHVAPLTTATPTTAPSVETLAGTH